MDPGFSCGDVIVCIAADNCQYGVMTDSEGTRVTCGFVKGFDNTGHFVPFLYKNGALYMNDGTRPERGQDVYLASPCSRTSSPV
ncbi:hypothetical protein I8K75_000372 [Salmonella enterica]|nr:hypothetical protein [Salmonella enterica]